MLFHLGVVGPAVARAGECVAVGSGGWGFGTYAADEGAFAACGLCFVVGGALSYDHIAFATETNGVAGGNHLVDGIVVGFVLPVRPEDAGHTR